MTDVLNRAVFEKDIHSMANSKCAVILIDFNKFKEVNDTYGHSKGDFCLKVIAGIIRDSFYPVGKCYRIGGDEFCVLSSVTQEMELKKYLNLILNKVEQARARDNVIPFISYGYDIYKGTGDIMKSFKNSDKNMYFYKKSYKRTHKP